jgi:hypothetical protein
MATVSSHLKSFHKASAKCHAELAERHTAMSKCHSDIATHYADDDKLRKLHESLADEHSATSQTHERAAEQNLSACAAIGDLSTAKVVPTGASGINNNPERHDDGVRKVVRYGQPEKPDTAGIPADLEALVETH